MPKDIDQRDYSFIRAFDPVTAEMKSSKKLLGNQTIKINYVNQFIGGAEQIQSLYPSDEAPAGITEAVHVASPQLELSDQAVIALALKHLERTGAALGFRQSEKPEFVPDPLVKRTSGGARIVNFLQHHHGIPVFQMERSVEIDKTGAVRSVDGMSTSLPLDLEIMPRVSLENAVLAAADYIALPTGKVDHFTQEPIPDTVIDLGDYEPKVLARIPFTSQPSVLDKGPFGDVIPAHLVFFYQGPETRLAWHMIISTKGIRDQYIVIVEADSKTRDPKHPSVLYGKSTLSYMALATGEVWKHNPDVNKTRKPVNFPRPVEEYPVNPPPVLPQGFPFHWVKDGLDVTQGNNTIAVFGAEGLPCRGVQGIDDIIVFDPDEEKGNEQKVLNAFYFCNFMHDLFFMLGFDESQNFQDVNLTGIGKGGDPVQVIVSNQRLPDLAFMATLADGSHTVMSLGSVVSTDATLHTALDSDVVFHEFTHGVVRRSVGRSLDLFPLQDTISQGLDEGWADYYALTIQNFSLEPERTRILDYATSERRGIRSGPYDDDYPVHAAEQADIPVDDPQGAYGLIGLPPYTNRHAIGEIWAATLMKMNRDLIIALGDKSRGHRIGWQIVFNGLQKCSANPTFIQARDKILTALDDLPSLTQEERRSARRAAWGAFAHFGIGVGAKPSNPGTLRTVGDKSLPLDL